MIENLAPLAALRNLTSLNLSGCLRIKEITSLIALNLDSLNISGCKQIEDLSPLAGHLKNLRSLNFGDCAAITGLNPLSSFSNLRILRIPSVKGLDDLRSLQPLRYLETLDLSQLVGPKLATMRALELSHLSERISSMSSSKQTAVSSETIDFDALSKLKSLRVLDISGMTNVSQLPPMRDFDSLQVLNIGGWRKLLDLQPPASLIGLRNLNLAGCENVTDLSPLRTHRNLEVLSLVRADKITDFSPLVRLSWLRHIYVDQRQLGRLPPRLKGKAYPPQHRNYSDAELLIWEANLRFRVENL
jgi:hypothetical protein